ncbi:hypothetical protein N7468_006191 [Penicillium chermesinum]|uniref:Enoyl reductase (ER) domain-containing protein n=1 Tax=Penicillium chermesinum TaxID=63820 RepID=A0A9W9NS59_9EURO|nr:uncharacterized protein N7468_006191 [Penicillium chermesinum]KAJ5224966.1 hypothetical protein N7468_006191 [Penicillium chermesinum]
MIDQGHRFTSWPLVPGLDGAGVVDQVGAAVERFSPGDRVAALFAPGDRSASYQEFSVVKETSVAKIPDAWSFESAASLGVSYLTAVMALGGGLQSPLPFLENGPTTGFVPSSVLVLGGSSALGAAVVQLLRLSLPGSRVFTTSSPKHHAYQKQVLGVDQAFPRESPSLVDDVKSATEGGCGVDAIIDAVGAGATQSKIFEAFNKDGPKRYAQVWTGDDEIRVPDGVDSVLFRSRDLPQIQGHENVMKALQGLLEDGKYRPPLPLRVVGRGLPGLKEGLDIIRGGVSGEKLVVNL